MLSLRIAVALLLLATPALTGEPWHLSLQSRSGYAKKTTKEQWDPLATAIIICDMWDTHTSPNAVSREKELAPRLNEFVQKARSDGALIIHAPSACMAAYDGTPARLRAINAPTASRTPSAINQWCRQIPTEESAVYPIDQADGGSDDEPETHRKWAEQLAAQGRNPKAPWQRQIDLIQIDQDRDAVSDSGSEIWNLLEAKKIRNVVLAGVHTNMCVAGRPFGLRQMARNGLNVALLRDLTDSMYNPRAWPYVSHFRGTELFIEHTERHICPTLTSDQLLGGQPFKFSSATAGPRRLQVLLIGDSTTEAIIPKQLAPEEPQFEDVIRILLAQHPNLPPVDVHNLGLSGEFIERLLTSGRYDREIKNRPSADIIYIRYGLNDRSRRKDFSTNFPADFHALIAKLREDHPKATIIPMTVIPYLNPEASTEINEIVRNVAKTENLELFDIFPAYAEELKKGQNMLNYRRYPLARIPVELQPLARPYLRPGNDPTVVVQDNRLDALLGHLPGWFADRHPNQAGYHVIARETANHLAQLLKKQTPPPR
jgi:lysophospholipase L1-like esterase/nicotinamidase-related amidase